MSRPLVTARCQRGVIRSAGEVERFVTERFAEDSDTDAGSRPWWAARADRIQQAVIIMAAGHARLDRPRIASR